MDHNDYLVRYVYIPLAAFAGAVSSLGARQWRDMTRARLALAIVMGASFAIFVTPWIAHTFVKVEEDDARAIVALTYLMAIGAHILLPKLIQWLGRLLGSGDAR